jgi:hypothetical protein
VENLAMLPRGIGRWRERGKALKALDFQRRAQP